MCFKINIFSCRFWSIKRFTYSPQVIVSWNVIGVKNSLTSTVETRLYSLRTVNIHYPVSIGLFPHLQITRQPFILNVFSSILLYGNIKTHFNSKGIYTIIMTVQLARAELLHTAGLGLITSHFPARKLHF